MASGAAAAQAEKDQMQQAASPTLKPQSRSAVHYLAISPPRIRVTDAQGTGLPLQLTGVPSALESFLDFVKKS